MWKAGDHLSHRYNAELGPGRVVQAEGRRLVVEFPQSKEILQFAANADALVLLKLVKGSPSLPAPSLRAWR